MYFEIQISNPAIRPCPHEERESLSAALPAIFPEPTEDAIMVWNWIPVKINYNCDLSVMMEDILFMLREILASDKGSTVTIFGANTFRVEWSISWEDQSLRVESNWQSISGSYEQLLNDRNILEVQKDRFLREWKSLLTKVINAIETSGIRIEDKEQVELLHHVEGAIDGDGYLYG